METVNDIERLAYAQAIYKASGELVDTKNPESLRGQVDAQYRQLYEMTGAKSFDISLDGEKVGTYSMRFSKGATTQRFAVHDYVELARWFETLANDELRDLAAQNLRTVAEWAWNAYGEIPDGCTIETETTEGGEYLGGTLKVDTHRILQRMAELPGTFETAALLEGGIDEA